MKPLNVPEEAAMTCEEVIDVAAAYALGIMEPDEEAACTRHLEEPGAHRGCAQAISEARVVAARLASAVPAQAPSANVWRAIEARVGASRRAGASRWRILRELSGWFVAAAVLGFYLYGAPVDTRRRAAALESSSSGVRSAMTLLSAPGTRLHLFTGPGAARGSLILNPDQRHAAVLCDRVAPDPTRRLRLWAARGTAAPFALGPLTVDPDGVASAEIGPALFEPTLPERLLISKDPPGSEAPGEILLVAELH
jgi:anti-sigma-K factor RskA